MRTYCFLILLLVVIPFSVIAQEQEKLQWQENRPLTWEDFRAAPKQGSPFSANTNSGLSYSWNFSTSSGKPVLEQEVKSNFYPDLSWVKEIKNKQHLLAHEQLHFDITELHARKLRKQLDSYEIGRTVRKDLKRIYNRVEAERVEMQNLFDRETAHSGNKMEQERWRKFISEELLKLSDFSS